MSRAEYHDASVPISALGARDAPLPLCLAVAKQQLVFGCRCSPRGSRNELTVYCCYLVSSEAPGVPLSYQTLTPGRLGHNMSGQLEAERDYVFIC